MHWEEKVGRSIDAADLTTQQIRRLAFKVVVHAFRVNCPYWTHRTFFGERVATKALAAMKQIVAAFEAALEEETETLDRDTISELLEQANPEPDSLPGIIPGWVALLDAFVEALGESWEDFYWAIGNAYASIANRAYCEAHGIEGNCGFGFDEAAAEAEDALCRQEAQFQLEQLAQIAR